MPRWIAIVFLFVATSTAVANEVRFTNGPHEFGGARYYWLAEWKLEVTLPGDVTGEDRLEVLFGSKGAGSRRSMRPSSAS